MKIKEQNPDKVQKPQLNITVVMCSACGEEIPDHEKYPTMVNMDIDEIECISCEMKYHDSADIDNCLGVS